MSSRFGTSELIDMVISFIVLTIAFSIRGGLRGSFEMPEASTLVITAVGVGTGFMLHELAHKFVAQRYGYWAEYKANMTGLLFTVLMAAVFGFVFAAPGAVMIRKLGSGFGNYSMPQSTYSPDDDRYWDAYDNRGGGEEAKIAVAGPVTNVLLAAFFFAAMMMLLGMQDVDPLFLMAAYYAMYINIFLAAFNMLPVGPLDGAKVLRSNPLLWGIVGLPAILATLILMFSPDTFLGIVSSLL